MELTNEFRVGVPVARAYDVLTDVERIAPCLPGAQLQEIEGEQYRGIVKVKVGPITANYQGVATFVERDAPHRIVLRAEGREARGQGNAAAVITLVLTPDGDGTAVSVVTDLTITGKVAQFGRGVLADVSAKLLGQFVECLESKLLDEPTAEATPETAEVLPPVVDEPAAPVDAPVVADVEPAVPEPLDGEALEPVAEPEAAKPVVRRIESAPVEPVNLVSAAGNPVAKRAAPVLGGIAVLWLLRVLLRRRKRR